VFYLAAISMTTVGYGDIFPVTVGGKIIAVVMIFTGIVFISFPISVIGSNFYVLWKSTKDGEQEIRGLSTKAQLGWTCTKCKQLNILVAKHCRKCNELHTSVSLPEIFEDPKSPGPHHLSPQYTILVNEIIMALKSFGPLEHTKFNEWLQKATELANTADSIIVTSRELAAVSLRDSRTQMPSSSASVVLGEALSAVAYSGLLRFHGTRFFGTAFVLLRFERLGSFELRKLPIALFIFGGLARSTKFVSLFSVIEIVWLDAVDEKTSHQVVDFVLYDNRVNAVCFETHFLAFTVQEID